MDIVISIMLYLLLFALCFSGTVLSCFSISGTWLVVIAAILAALFKDSPFPGLWTVIVFVVLSVVVEIAEALAGYFGVKRRGGSGKAAFGAVGGGLLGMFLGSMVPPPIIGALICMFAGSFMAAFLIEWRRTANSADAGHVAMGAVVSRIGVMLLKILVTLIMSGYLLLGMLLNLEP